MRLTERTDIAIQILVHLALLKGAKISVDSLVDRHIGHRSQVVAAIQSLRKAGMIASTPGRNGGIWMDMPPEEIRVAEIVRMFESDFCLTRCFSNAESCSLYEWCKLKDVLQDSLDRFFEPLEKTTIADLVAGPAPDFLKEELAL